MRKSLNIIAVILPLIFVGIQIRDAVKTTRSATANETINIMAQWYLTMSEENRGKDFFYFINYPDSLTAKQRFPNMMALHAIFLSFENSYYLKNEGTLDENIHESIVDVLLFSKNKDGLKLYWNTRKKLFSKDFQIYVDNILNDNKKYNGIFDEYK